MRREAGPRPPLSATFRALRNRNYRLFWTGQVVSQMGTWMQRVAQSWLVLQITDSPLALGCGLGVLAAVVYARRVGVGSGRPNPPSSFPRREGGAYTHQR